MKSVAIGVVATARAGGPRRSAAQVPAGWMRVQIDSEIFKGRLTFEYGTLGRYLEPILARLAEDRSGPVAAAPPAKAAPRKARAKRAESKKG